MRMFNLTGETEWFPKVVLSIYAPASVTNSQASALWESGAQSLDPQRKIYVQVRRSEKKEKMNEPKSRNALRIIWEKQSLIERHYFYFIVKWMLIFFFFFFVFFPALAANFLLLVVLPWKTKQNKTNTRRTTTNQECVYFKKCIFILFQIGSQDPNRCKYICEGPEFKKVRGHRKKCLPPILQIFQAGTNIYTHVIFSSF